MPQKIADNADAHVWAADVVAKTTGQPPPQGLLEEVLAKQMARDNKNPAAVALGRLGGLKGGNARAAALTPKQRSEIAKKAAAKRWEAKHRADIAAMKAKGVTSKDVARSLGLSVEKVNELAKRLRKGLPQNTSTTRSAVSR